jgi:VanZ family protein
LEIKDNKDIYTWDWRRWLWVFLCSVGIFITVPLARSIQQLVYKTVGREFFTYIVLFVVGTGLITILYFFIFKLKVKKVSQYLWLFICTGLYVYFTIQLKAHPEEAIHFLEYGLLSYFLFKALSHRIKDWTVYITAILFVLFVGTIDELLQWMIPRRFWDFRDIGLNTLAGGIFILALCKGIKPKIICMPLRKVSIKMLVGIITVDLIFLGLCLSNTPNSVNYYTTVLNTLSWLRNEEPMTEFGYKHKDPEIGIFYSRLTLEELREIDLTSGEIYGKILPQDISSKTVYEKFIEIYNPTTNPFLYELGVHLSRRDSNFDEFKKTDDLEKKIKISNVAFRENLLIEKYFGNTLKHSGLMWSDDKVKELKKTASLWEGNYISRTGRIITFFTLKTAWVIIFITLITVWTLGELLKRRLDN